MAKTILIPTDFHVESLNTLKIALDAFRDEQVSAVLMYSEYLENSITELLFYSPVKVINERITPEFREGKEIICNRFQTALKDCTLVLFHGYTNSAMKKFLEANHIDEIFIPKNYSLKTSRRAFNPIPMLKKSHLPVKEIQWDTQRFQTEKEQLATLFN